VRGQHRDALALDRGPHSDNRVAVLGGLHLVAVAGDPLLGHLQDDGVDAVTGEVVHLGLSGATLEIDPVERHAEVHEERVVALAGEHLAATGQIRDRLVGDLRVVRDGLRPDVVRGDGDVAGNRAHAAQHASLRAVLAAVALVLARVLARVLAALAGIPRFA
jgi:hypothetical protein